MSMLPRRPRALRCESLERRNLLAADMGLEHNFISPEDVDGSGDVTPYDALQVVNNLNRQGRSGAQGEDGGSSSASLMLDVDGDGTSSPSDAWRVINYLNQHGVHGALAGSLLPIYDRISALENALDSSSVPSWLGEGTARDILYSLHAGIVPELNSDLQDELYDALNRFDLQAQYNELQERFESITNRLPSYDSIFSQLGSQLSSQYEGLKDELADALDDLHDRAGWVLDDLFGHDYDDDYDNDYGADSNGTSNGTSSSPIDDFSDVLSHVDEELENLIYDVAGDLANLNFSGALNTLANVVYVHLPLLSSGLPGWFDSNIVDIPSDFSSELSSIYDRLESVYEDVGSEIEDAVDHIYDSLGQIGSVASQLGSFVHYLHGYGSYENAVA